MSAFCPPALLPRRALRGISMLYNWHQLIASYPGPFAGSGLVGEGRVLVGQSQWPEACLPLPTWL